MKPKTQMTPRPVKQQLICGICAAAVGFINGALGAGGGMLVVLLLTRLLCLQQHRAQATAVAIMLPVSAVSATIYALRDPVEWSTLGWLCIGAVAGAVLGAKLLYRFSTVWLKRIFGILMMISAVRMVWP